MADSSEGTRLLEMSNQRFCYKPGECTIELLLSNSAITRLIDDMYRENGPQSREETFRCTMGTRKGRCVANIPRADTEATHGQNTSSRQPGHGNTTQITSSRQPAHGNTTQITSSRQPGHGNTTQITSSRQPGQGNTLQQSPTTTTHTDTIARCQCCGKYLITQRQHNVNTAPKPYMCRLCAEFSCTNNYCNINDKQRFGGNMRQLQTVVVPATGRKGVQVNIPSYGHSRPINKITIHEGFQIANPPKNEPTVVRPQCRYCSEQFKWSHVKEHEKTDTGHTTYKCILCGATRARVKHFKSFVCSYCGKYFALFPTLVEHERIHTGRKTFLCSECGKLFISSSALASHDKTHSDLKAYKCEHCERSYRFRAGLSQHLKTHTAPLAFKCSYCDKRFTLRHNMAQHVALMHTDTTSSRVKCTYCIKRFDSRAEMLEHETIHDTNKLFKCSHCNKGFIKKANMTQHERIHTGEKPFKCHLCDKPFSSQGGLHNHKRSHSGLKPYKCATCGKCYVAKMHLRTHQAMSVKCKTLQYYTSKTSTVTVTDPK